jgi:hypothetical protein
MYMYNVIKLDSGIVMGRTSNWLFWRKLHLRLAEWVCELRLEKCPLRQSVQSVGRSVAGEEQASLNYSVGGTNWGILNKEIYWNGKAGATEALLLIFHDVIMLLYDITVLIFRQLILLQNLVFIVFC